MSVECFGVAAQGLVHAGTFLVSSDFEIALGRTERIGSGDRALI
jgi:hypothetical protein